MPLNKVYLAFYPLLKATRGVYPSKCDTDASVFFTEIELTFIKTAIFLAKVLNINMNKMECVGLSTETQAVETQNSIEQGALP